jgi:hypothetical protein
MPPLRQSEDAMSVQAVLPMTVAPARNSGRVEIDYANGNWLVWTPTNGAAQCREVSNLPDLLRFLGDELPDYAADRQTLKGKT